MKIEKVNIDELIPYANNAKEHPQEQITQIASSISEFGFNDPIAIDDKNVIIEGHGRLLAAQKLGLKEVPTIRLSHLTDYQKKAYIIAHNKLTMNTGFDKDFLSLELIELENSDIDLSKIGLSFDNLDMIDDDDDFMPDLPDEDRNPLRKMSLIVSETQFNFIMETIKKVSDNSIDPEGLNDNRNGNGIYYICELLSNEVLNG
jgi:ParB-like chromosome segregation protein Spo0J